MKTLNLGRKWNNFWLGAEKCLNDCLCFVFGHKFFYWKPDIALDVEERIDFCDRCGTAKMSEEELTKEERATFHDVVSSTRFQRIARRILATTPGYITGIVFRLNKEKVLVTYHLVGSDFEIQCRQDFSRMHWYDINLSDGSYERLDGSEIDTFVTSLGF